MPWYPRIRTAINSALPTLAATQATNLALLISALLARRTCCLSALARAFPTPTQRRVTAPKHDLLHRLNYSSLMPRPQHKDADEELQAIFTRQLHQDIIWRHVNDITAEPLPRRSPNVLPIVEHLGDGHVIGIKFVDLDLEQILWIAQMRTQAR